MIRHACLYFIGENKMKNITKKKIVLVTLGFLLGFSMIIFTNYQGNLKTDNQLNLKTPNSSQGTEIVKSLYPEIPLNNYFMFEDYEYSWIDASGGTELILGDDDYAAIALPFSFTFYNQTFSTIYLCSNGYLSFTDTAPLQYSNVPFPSADPTHTYMIAPFWDDLLPPAGGHIYYQSFGTYWVAEWLDIYLFAGPLLGSFQVVLYDTGEIMFNYDYIDHHSGYTCGLNLGVDTNYYNSYQDLNDLTDNFAILFTYESFDHDLSVSLDTPVNPEIGNSYVINATVTNTGLNDEYDVDLLLYLDDIIVESTTISILPVDASETISYMWIPPDFGLYNFTAYAPPVTDETYTGNNFITKIIPIIDCQSDHLWSPDGTKVAYIKSPSGEAWNCELWVADKNPSDAELINHVMISSEAEYNGLLDWQGDWILFRIRHEEGTPASYYGRGELWRIRADGTGMAQVTFTQTNGIRTEFYNPAYDNRGTAGWGRFIPGTDLVYFHAHDGNGWPKTFVCNADGTDNWYHISHPDNTWRVALSPTGNKLLWGEQYDFGQPTTHKACNVDGSGRTTIKAFTNVIAVTVLADGNTVIWTNNDNIYAIDMDGTNERTVLDDEYINEVWNYNPSDGQGLIMGSDRSDGNMHIYKINVDGTGIKQLTEGPYLDEFPILSPDGQYLSYLRLPYDFDKGSSTVPYPYELVVKSVAHDLSVSLEVPTIANIGNSYMINATVNNTGIYDETDVELLLYLDDVFVDSITIPSLPVGVNETINYIWTPTEYKTYNFTAYTSPVPGEINLGNNIATSLITIYVINSLTVTTPDSLTAWEMGTSQSITWTSTGTISDVKIELYKGGVFEMEIIASTTNDGTYNWDIPTDLEDGSDYQIKISDVANPATDDFSDNFEILTSIIDSLTVTKPDSTSTWETGTTQSITWTSTGTISDVKIELYKGGAFEMVIIASTTNDGTYNWAIPTDLEDGSDYQIKISDVSNPATYDESSNFVITSFEIPGYNLYIVIGIMCVVSVILLKKRFKLIK